MSGQTTIEGLLAEQAMAVQRVAAINRLVARRIAEVQVEQVTPGAQDANGGEQSALGALSRQANVQPSQPAQGASSRQETLQSSRSARGALSRQEALQPSRPMTSLNGQDVFSQRPLRSSGPVPDLHASTRTQRGLHGAGSLPCFSVPESPRDNNNGSPQPVEEHASPGDVPRDESTGGGGLLGWLPWSHETQETHDLHESLLGHAIKARRQRQRDNPVIRERLHARAIGRMKLDDLFPDIEATKKTIMEFIITKVWDSEAAFFDTGFFQWVARHEYFKSIMLAVIVLNSLWLSIDTDFNRRTLISDAPLEFQIVENFFCGVFIIEICLRFFAYRSTSFAFMDPWFVFDSLLVLLMVWQTWVEVLMLFLLGDRSSFRFGRAASVLRILRLLRLSRVVRLHRLVRSVPELHVLVKGMIMAMRSVAAILVLEFLVIYVFAIMLTALLSNREATALVGEGKFQGVAQACNFLLLQVLCGIDAELLTSVFEYNIGCYVLFLFFVLVAQMGLLNMLTGVVCDVIGAVSSEYKDDTHAKDVDQQIGSIARALDGDKSGDISLEEFHQFFENPDIIKRMHNLGIDVLGVVDLVLVKLRYCESLKVEEFLRMLSQLRTDKIATVKDVLDMRSFMSSEITEIQDHIMVLHNESKWF